MSNDLGLTATNGGCACCSTDSVAAAPAAVPEEAVTETYLVEGMTCSHCVASVTEEVSALEGVANVSVDLKVGGASRLEVVSSLPLSEESVRAAVTEAGYALVSA